LVVAPTIEYRHPEKLPEAAVLAERTAPSEKNLLVSRIDCDHVVAGTAAANETAKARKAFSSGRRMAMLH
jgi:hypothetical protein